jgi:2-polyprenyl-3-methyl-5-hydroxy-6-metoxy-1,4-benzoquinol methylase
MSNNAFNIFPEDLIETPCAICNSSRFAEIKTGDRFGLPVTAAMCMCCGLVMINPRPSEKWFQNFYRHHYRTLYESITEPNDEYIKNNRRINKHLTNLNFISEHFDLNNRKVIDIGSAEGLLLNLLEDKYKCKVTGIEANINFAEYSKSKFNLSDIRVGDFFDLISEGEYFDLIYCSHVFEHILDPNLFLQKCNSMLTDDGLLFIDVPDLLTERKGIHYFHIAHVFYYSITSLTNILSKNGFKVISITNQIKFHAHKQPPWTIHVLAKKSNRPFELKKLGYNPKTIEWLKNQWI